MHTLIKPLMIAAALTMGSTCTWAQTAGAPAAPATAQTSVPVTVTDPWIRATVAQQKATGAFMKLQSSAELRLVGGSSPLAGIVEVHEMAMAGDVMKMRAIAGLPLSPGKAVELRPGGYHVMLMDLKSQAKEGDMVPLTLVFEGKDGKKLPLELKVPVKPLAAAPKADGHAGHGHHGMKH